MNAETRDVLSEHRALAVFDGVAFHPCRRLTSLCPDRCGHAGHNARFTIRQYLHYAQHGDYGDPRQKEFSVRVGDAHGDPQGDPAIRGQILALEPGDWVLLAWRHEYVTRDDARFPNRTVTELTRLEPPQAEAMLRSGTPPAEE